MTWGSRPPLRRSMPPEGREPGLRSALRARSRTIPDRARVTSTGHVCGATAPARRSLPRWRQDDHQTPRRRHTPGRRRRRWPGRRNPFSERLRRAGPSERTAPIPGSLDRVGSPSRLLSGRSAVTGSIHSSPSARHVLVGPRSAGNSPARVDDLPFPDRRRRTPRSGPVVIIEPFEQPEPALRQPFGRGLKPAVRSPLFSQFPASWDR